MLELLDDLELGGGLPRHDDYCAPGRNLVLGEDRLRMNLEPEQEAALVLIDRGYNEQLHRDLVHAHITGREDEDFADAVINAIHYVERDIEEFLCGAGFAQTCGFSTSVGFEDAYTDDERDENLGQEEREVPTYYTALDDQDCGEDYDWDDASLRKEWHEPCRRVVDDY